MLNAFFNAVPVPVEEFEANLQKFDNLNWYIVPLFVIVVLFFVQEAKKKKYSLILAAIAFFSMDVFNELWNCIAYAVNGYPVWGCTFRGGSAYQPLIGWNIEIILTFFLCGIFACAVLKTTPGFEGEKFMDANKN